LFWSVGEPISHFINSPNAEPRTVEAARESMEITFFHWGLHAWGIYALVGMALAIFTFNKKLPLTISLVFYPLLGKKVHGPWGKVINVLAVVATLFGLATSLGLGVQQVSAGLAHLFNLPDTISTGLPFTLLLIVLMWSLLKGLRKEHSGMMETRMEAERKQYLDTIAKMMQKIEQAKASGKIEQKTEK
jgi:choline/glycine/proline betaine transport protein